MLGRAWRAELDRMALPYSAPSHAELDLTDAEAIRRVVGPEFRKVVNCAAWTDVDGAETNEEAATALNGRAVGLLAERCRGTGALLVQYGTDYVFRGDADRPYPVDAPRDPAGAYGRSKAAGEAALEASGAAYLNVRTSWLYAPWGKNFVRTIARLCREKESIRVVDDQRGRPTSAEWLARATLTLLQRGATGTCHITDGGECTWFGFAREIARLTGSACRVEPCTTDEFPRPARRPAYSVLDLAKTEGLIGAMPDWKANLAEVVARME